MGKTTWWLGENKNSKESKPIIRMWKSLHPDEKNHLKIKGFCLFPELLGAHQSKFERLSLWLAITEGVITPNIRDLYTAGGQEDIIFEHAKYRVPKIISHLINNKKEIKETLPEIDPELLVEYWESTPRSELYLSWVKLVSAEALKTTKFPLEKYLLEGE